MPEEVKQQEVKKEEPKKKGPLSKLKEKAEDSEEHLAILSTFVRLGILVWSCLLYTSPSPRDQRGSRMPSSA